MAKKKTVSAPLEVKQVTSSTAAVELPRRSIASSLWSIYRTGDAQRGIQLITLTAIYSSISQLTLSPIYGFIPAGLCHRYGTMAVALLAIALRGKLPALPRYAFVLPVFAFWIPTIQFMLFKYSSIFGNPLGPIITEAFTYYPIVFMSVYMALWYLDRVDTKGADPLIPEMGYPMFVFGWLVMAQRLLRGVIVSNAGVFVLMNRVILQLVIATLYSLIIPNQVFWPAIPSVAFTMIANVHNPFERTTEVLKNTLALSGYDLLDRRESLTGYLSVLESQKDHFRVLRCDHSLLGGIWVPEAQASNMRVQEPIYAIFAMLEAVRLVERPASNLANQEQMKALNIGLGVGTTPKSLIAHGVNTTVIELDPFVHYFAGTYFDFPLNHSIVIGDAVQVVGSWAQHGHPDRYDYIVHDVFTGGVEPAELFTYEFLKDLASLLKDDGVVAINIAGDEQSPVTTLIYQTILSVFPSCRIFRESEKQSPEFSLTNMAIFCTKGQAPVIFRAPVEADYLGSTARRDFLPPRFEIDPLSIASWIPSVGELLHLTGPGMRQVKRSQAKSAIEHWKVMRTVLPDFVWENW